MCLFSKKALNSSKLTVKTFKMLQNISILNLSKNPEKKRVSQKTKQHKCADIDNNKKCFLSSKSAYENDF